PPTPPAPGRGADHSPPAGPPCAAPPGPGAAALRLTGPPYERARRLVGRTGHPWQSFALTGALLAWLPLWAGSALPLADRAADPATLALLVPALLVVTPLLVAVQAWTWYAFRHRVTRPSYL
ncbi:cytochrome d ubiquinol oxidase subunit II, partial [Streptomyces sp. NPDC096068]